MVTLTVILFWLLTDDSFRVTEASVSFRGLQHADRAAVLDHLSGIDRSPNIFRVRTSELVSELQLLPEVDAASAKVTLPADVSVHLDEREPIFVWSDGEVAWLVDEEGMLFAPGVAATSSDDAAAAASNDDPEVAATDAPRQSGVTVASRMDLPVVEDGRLVDDPPTVGSFLPTSDQLIMRQLLAITPDLLGSRSTELQLRVDQHDGYVLHSDRGWQAVFGHYTPSVQPPSAVSRQVQCLRWLLAAEERKLERVRLALSDSGCGTFTKIGGAD